MGDRGSVFIHAVWSTWRRASLVDEQWAGRLYEAIRVKARQLRSPVLALGGTSDHVHLLVRLHSAVSVSHLVGEVKGFSSYVANRVVMGALFRWQEGFWSTSLARDDLSTVTRYILRQSEHHGAGTLFPELEPRDED